LQSDDGSGNSNIGDGGGCNDNGHSRMQGNNAGWRQQRQQQRW